MLKIISFVRAEEKLNELRVFFILKKTKEAIKDNEKGWNFLKDLAMAVQQSKSGEGQPEEAFVQCLQKNCG